MRTKRRLERNAAYKDFLDDSEELFEGFLERDKHAKELNKLYTFHACPGGAMLGINEREIEIKYGAISIGVKKKLNSSFQIQQSSVLARGAALQYYRADNGYVTCSLYPATSENMKPSEDVILIGIVKDPSKLRRLAYRHWKYFVSYMETTCIDGNPNLLHKITAFYLRYFKCYHKNDQMHRSRIRVFLLKAAKVLLSVGLSGFLIFVLSRYLDCSKQDSVSQLVDIETEVSQDSIEDVAIGGTLFNAFSSSIDYLLGELEFSEWALNHRMNQALVED